MIRAVQNRSVRVARDGVGGKNVHRRNVDRQQHELGREGIRIFYQQTYETNLGESIETDDTAETRVLI